MLPFLKQQRKQTGLIIEQRKPDGVPSEKYEEGSENESLEACAEDILRAITSKDSKHLALALRAAYDCLESEEPKDEEANDYDSLNEKAARDAQE